MFRHLSSLVGRIQQHISAEQMAEHPYDKLPWEAFFPLNYAHTLPYYQTIASDLILCQPEFVQVAKFLRYLISYEQFCLTADSMDIAIEPPAPHINLQQIEQTCHLFDQVESINRMIYYVQFLM